MRDHTRDAILSRLKNAPKTHPLPSRPQVPPMDEEGMGAEQLVEQFRKHLEEQTVVFHRVTGNDGVLDVLTRVFEKEGISTAVASTDPLIANLDLPRWAKERGITITTHRDYADRNAFKKGVFTEAEAGITGVDYGVAESGTLCLLSSPNMPRLTSLAPVTHVAVMPTNRLLPTYEHMVRLVFGKAPPSQVIWISGPSQTADIQATLFKGMHGPRSLIVILKDD